MWRRFLEESTFLREYLSKYRRLLAIGLLALVVIDVLDVIPPILLKEAVDTVESQSAWTTLLWLAGAYMAVTLVQCVGRYAWRMYLIRMSAYAARDLRDRFSGHLFGLSLSFFERRRIGDMMSLATTDMEAVRLMIGAGVLIMADALFYFLTVPVAMYFLSPQLTLIAFIPLPVIPWIVMRNERKIHERFGEVQSSLDRITALTQEGMSGIRVVKALAAEDVQLGRFRALANEYLGLSMRLARVQSTLGPLLEFTMSFGLVLLLIVGGRQLIGSSGAAATGLTLGVFVAFQRYIQQMVWPMTAIGLAVTYYRRSATSTGRLEAVFGEASDVADVRSPKLPAALTTRVARKTPGRIEFRNLRFRFPGADTDVLRGITLDIESGERVAFVGLVGAGKSALLALLPRLYPVDRGMLLIDGVDINDWPLDDLRRQVGYVSQDVFLFSESVTENVALGLHETHEPSIDISAIHEATELAAVHDDIVGLASAYDTRIGERGVSLSGGQRQRLTIARAVIKRPPILVLDDVLSSVDVRTEEAILTALRQRSGRNTEVIAAHRISTIRDADRIAVLDQGQLASVGSHANLIAETGGLYWRLYEQQRLKEDLERYVDQEQEPW